MTATKRENWSCCRIFTQFTPLAAGVLMFLLRDVSWPRDIIQLDSMVRHHVLITICYIYIYMYYTVEFIYHICFLMTLNITIILYYIFGSMLVVHLISHDPFLFGGTWCENGGTPVPWWIILPMQHCKFGVYTIFRPSHTHHVHIKLVPPWEIPPLVKSTSITGSDLKSSMFFLIDSPLCNGWLNLYN